MTKENLIKFKEKNWYDVLLLTRENDMFKIRHLQLSSQKPYQKYKYLKVCKIKWTEQYIVLQLKQFLLDKIKSNDLWKRI